MKEFLKKSLAYIHKDIFKLLKECQKIFMKKISNGVLEGIRGEVL